MRYADADTGKAHSFVRKQRDVTLPNTWANKVYALLRKDQPKWAGFDMRPKGEVT